MQNEIILGVVQGLTEFLPVSSSGHLLLAAKLLGQKIDTTLILAAHMGTLLSVVLFFSKKIFDYLKDKNKIFQILITCFITGIIVLIFKDFFDRALSKPLWAVGLLIVNGIMLIIANKFLDKGKEDISYKHSFFMGLIQSIAVLPGISRSGSTISALTLSGAKKEAAFEYSFIAAIPLIFGAFLLDMKDVYDAGNLTLRFFQNNFLIAVTAFVTGLLALSILRFIIKKTRFDIFGYYCIIIATIFLFFK